jgi:hypothetical protein
LPDGESYPSPDMRLLGQIVSDAGLIAGGGGLHTQSSMSANPVLTVPGVQPGNYRLVVRSDVLNQIAELDEMDNVYTSAPFILQAIPIQGGGSAQADLPDGASRWFELSAPADLTIDLELVHDDPSARCELYLRESEPPSLGLYDLASEGLDAIDPHQQAIRIPRTSGMPYFVLARTVSGAGMTSNATLDAVVRDFGVADVQPSTVGAGVVTIGVEGFQLWRASSIELRDANGGVAAALELSPLEGDMRLARFDLTGAPLGPRELYVIDGTSMTEVPWSGVVDVVSPAPLAVQVALDLAPSIRRGETGPGVLRLTNAGNVDLPFALAALGHLPPSGMGPEDGLAIASPALGPLETDGTRSSLVVVVEDLGPGRTHDVPLQLAVGAQYPLADATLAVAGVPATRAGLEQGPLLELSQALRAAVAADPATPALLSGVAQNAAMWDAVVDMGLSTGAIAIDLETMHSSSSVARSARDLLDALADGVEIVLMLPIGAMVPASAIDAAAQSAWCAPFAGTGFNCDGLFPTGCAGGSAGVSVVTQAAGNVPVGVACTGTPAPQDPNEKLPPTGVGPEQIVSANEPIRYEVHFENDPAATAWASRVRITDALEPGIRSSSVRFLELRIGQTTIPFPPNTSSYVGQVELTIDATTTVVCQISALVDASNDEVLVVLQALDPMTGIPRSQGDWGLLPPSAPGVEQLATGYLAFSVLPAEGAPGLEGDLMSISGQRLVNTTNIDLNANPPIETNTVQNTLDDGAPASTFGYSLMGTDVLLTWGADDVEQLPQGDFQGTGVRSYTLSTAPSNHGPWTAVLTDTQETSHVFPVPFGATYAFKVEAKDNVGNVEHKDVADATLEMYDCNGNGTPDGEDLAAGTSRDLDGDGIPDECQCMVESACVLTPNSVGPGAAMSIQGTPSFAANDLQLVVTGAPPNAPGVFFYGREQAPVPLFGGFECVKPPLRRFRAAVTDGAGSAQAAFPLGGPSGGLGPNVVRPGESFIFQFLYRDAPGPNVSDAVRIRFCL